MSTVYRIAKFDEVFVKADHRKAKGEWKWVSMPVDFTSAGYQTLVEDHQEHPDDIPLLYGCWCALVAVAARLPVPGTLANSRGIAITPERAAQLAHQPAEPMRKLFAWASSQHVGWLEVVSQPDSIPPASGQHPDDSRRSSGLQNSTEQIQNKTEQHSAPASAGTTRAKASKRLMESQIEAAVAEVQPERLRDAVAEWLGYKIERNEAPLPKGLRAALTRATKLCKRHGIDRLEDAMQAAMSAGHQGYEHNLRDEPVRGSPSRPSDPRNAVGVHQQTQALIASGAIDEYLDQPSEP